jgi:hypothetical protein
MREPHHERPQHHLRHLPPRQGHLPPVDGQRDRICWLLLGLSTICILVCLSVSVGYWILPKPVDLSCLAFDALGAQTHFRPILENSAGLSLGLSVLTSLLFTVYILIAAERQFAKMDY